MITVANPADEEFSEVGPGFVSVCDEERNKLQTVQLNEGYPAFWMMLETEEIGTYSVCDKMNLYAWWDTSAAKRERFPILPGGYSVVRGWSLTRHR